MAYVQIGITESGNVKKFKGYSIDAKPTSDIGSGSKCYEQDTKKVWVYDSVNTNPMTNDNWWLDNVDENDFTDNMDSVDIRAQLAEKANQVDVTALQTSVTNIGNASPKGVYTTVPLLTAAKPTGDTGIYLVTGNVAEVASLAISAIPTLAGNVTITLNGVAFNVALDTATDTTTALVATKIRNTSFSGWTTGGTGSTITFTCNTTGIKTDSTYSAGTTGSTGTMSTTTQGVDNDGKWYYWNGSAWTPGGIYQATGVVDKTIKPSQTTFIEKSAKRNRIDETIKQDGYRGNTSLGGKIADANYLFFEKVAIEPNATYSVWCQNDDPTYYSYTQARFINFYDQSGTYLGAGTSLGSWLSSFTSPTNAYFADISFNFKGTNFILVPTANVNDYLPFRALESSDLFISLQQSAIDSKDSSLIDDTDFTSGYYLNVSNGTNAANVNYKVSSFIAVETGETYVIDGINLTDLTRTLEGAKNISFFDSGRAFAFTTSASSVYLKEFTVSEPIKFIRFDTNINTNNIVLYKKDNSSRKEIVGTKHLPSLIKITCDNISPNFKKEIKKAEQKVIASFGDSLTAGTGGGGTSYSSILESLTGIRVENYGIGGENINTIASRQGGLVMLVNNITIPSARNTPVNIGTTSQGLLLNTGKYAFPLLQGYGTYGGINNCIIAGVLGQIQNVSGVYQFSRYVSGSEVIINRPTPIITDVATRKPYNKMVIWIGQNGGYDSTSEWISVIKQMIDFSGLTDYIVCGLTSGTASSRVTEEKAFLDEFGRHYINLRKYLVAYGLDDAGITPTAADLEDIANGETPVSLRVGEGDVHFNASGYTVIGQQIYKCGQELGYW